MINRIIELIQKLIKKIKQWFGLREKRTTNQSNRLFKMIDPQEYNNNDWVEIKTQTKSTNFDETVDADEDVKFESLKDMYFLNENKEIDILMPVTCGRSASYQVCYTEPNRFLVLVRDDDFVCLYPKIIIAGKTVNVYTGHTLKLASSTIRNIGQMINPQVYVEPKGKTTIPMIHAKVLGQATIMTQTVEGFKCAIIETVVTTNINVMYMIKGKPRIGTAAIVFTLMLDEEYVWSGSLVQYQKGAFIVSNTTRYEEENIIKIVAVAIAHFDYNINTI